MKTIKILFINFFVFISIVVSSCSKDNKDQSTTTTTTTVRTNIQSKGKVSSLNNNDKISLGNTPSGKSPLDVQYIPSAEKILQKLDQKGSFAGKCMDNSHNIIQTQEVFVSGTMICVGSIINVTNNIYNTNYTLIFFKPETDSKGQKFQTVAKILASDHQWKIGSINEVEGTNKGLSILVADELTKKAEQELSSELSTQVVVGTASREGSDILEKERAHKRAVEIRKFITINYGVRPKYLLNMGRFKEEKCKDKYYHEGRSTRYQRPIIIMSILRESNSPEPEQKNIEIMLKKNLDSLGFGLSYQCYSDFNLGL
jgi:hypothetical protein